MITVSFLTAHSMKQMEYWKNGMKCWVHYSNIEEDVKKLLQVERAGRDIEKVLQRYIFALTALDEKPR